jgi:hypothetical protein
MADAEVVPGWLVSGTKMGAIFCCLLAVFEKVADLQFTAEGRIGAQYTMPIPFDPASIEKGTELQRHMCFR